MQPIFSRLIAILSPIFLSIQCLDAAEVQPVQSDALNLGATDPSDGPMQLVQYDYDDDDEENGDYTQTDVWFGPGFYFGIWFDNEGDYWGWRGNHRGYPSNRGYYHPNRAVHYNNRGNSGGGKSGGGGHSGGGGGGHK